MTKTKKPRDKIYQKITKNRLEEVKKALSAKVKKGEDYIFVSFSEVQYGLRVERDSFFIGDVEFSFISDGHSNNSYAEFDVINRYKDKFGTRDDFAIEGVEMKLEEGMGVTFFFNFRRGATVGIFIAFYNGQTDYYTDDVSFSIKTPSSHDVFDASSFSYFLG